MMSKKAYAKTVLIVDDHPVFRQGLRTIINSSRGIFYRIVGEAVSVDDALKQTAESLPDLILMDISLSGPGDGIVLTRRIVESYPDSKVLIITMHAKIDYVCEAFNAGARGYLTKDSAADELLKAMYKVLKGEEYLDPDLSPAVINTLKQARVRNELVEERSYATLSDREQEIFRLLAFGDKAVDISRQLNISPKTVENHRANIFKKLNLTRYFDLYQYAGRIGVIDPEL
jgi:DNA-binding NarL/FixJ family response regulator